MSRISVVVPIYNVEQYIDKCISSILNQSFTDLEIILVDDGSKDKSGEICDRYKSKDNRIKVIHKENGGLSSARNAGIEIATSEYIAFVDGDDFIHKDMYSILFEEILKNKSDIVICNFERIYDKQVEQMKAFEDVKSKKFNNIQALEMLYGDEGAQFTVAWNKLYKRELFDNIRYDYGKIHEDEFIIHKLLYVCKNICYINLPLYYYVQRENSIINSEFNIKKLDVIYAMSERNKFFYQIGEKELKYKAEYNYIRYFFENYFKAKNMVSKNKKEILCLKLNFLKNINSLLKNPLYVYKEKIAWIVFLINSKWYEKLLN